MGESLDPVANKRSRLSYALEFVRVKLAQRLYNPKATDQIAVVLFGGKTNNSLQDQDGYDHIEELIPMRQPSYDDFSKLEAIELGDTDTDIISALYVAGNLVRNAVVRRKDSKKQIILITDADQPSVTDEDGNSVACTDWDNEDWLNPLYGSIIPGLNGSTVLDWKMLFTLGIMCVYSIPGPGVVLIPKARQRDRFWGGRAGSAKLVELVGREGDDRSLSIVETS
jgi:hypothetical protein